MPVWLEALVATIWTLIGPVVTDLLAYFAGKTAQKEKDRADASEAALNEISRADDAAAPVDGMSDDDVLRDLRKRGRVRDLP